MPIGAGKYDNECTLVRELTQAETVLVIVIKGKHGSGFSAQSSAPTIENLPEMLEVLAQEIRASVKGNKVND